MMKQYRADLKRYFQGPYTARHAEYVGMFLRELGALHSEHKSERNHRGFTERAVVETYGRSSPDMYMTRTRVQSVSPQGGTVLEKSDELHMLCSEKTASELMRLLIDYVNERVSPGK